VERGGESGGPVLCAILQLHMCVYASCTPHCRAKKENIREKGRAQRGETVCMRETSRVRVASLLQLADQAPLAGLQRLTYPSNPEELEGDM